MEIFVARDGTQLGPLSAEEVRKMINREEIGPDDLLWHEPMVDWQPAHRVFDFSKEDAVPAPPAAISPVAAPGPDAYNRREVSSRESETYVPANRLSRLLAAIIDSAVLMISLIPAFAFAGIGLGLESNVLVAAGALLGLVAVLGLLVYQTRLLLSRGMTIGKRMISVRVIADNHDEPLGFGRVIGLRIVVPSFIGSIPLIGPLFSLLDALFIFREDRKCIHDHLAGTKVVRVGVSTPGAPDTGYA